LNTALWVRQQRRRSRAWAITLLSAVLSVSLGGVAVIAAALAGAPAFAVPSEQAAASTSPSALARAEIPLNYLRLYETAAARYRVDWTILAGVGKVECDHGRDPDPSCTREGVTNSAGAGGPMQFISSTWARYGVDGDGDGRADRWDPADAIFSAAHYLLASGIRRDVSRALYAYNHASWYVAEVERWAARYRGGNASARALAVASAGAPSDPSLTSQTSTAVSFIPGERALLAPGDGHVALLPVGAPPVVQAMLMAGNELQDLPYGPGGHPDPRGAPEEDCSSTLNYVLYRSGVRTISEILRDNPLAQDYVAWGDPGPGRWVTIYATAIPTPHVFVTIAGLRLDTSHAGTDVGPNRNEDGPRWRILDHIPTWARWSVRHPPGL
jgi:hypothetical protein